MESRVPDWRRVPLDVRTLRFGLGLAATAGAVGIAGGDWRRGAGVWHYHAIVQPVISSVGERAMPQGVQLAQIERIFEILDRLEISREAVMIPLRPQGAGSVKRLPNGKLEIVVPADLSFDEWYASLEGVIKDVYAA
jgi:hypothetical protein